MQIIHRFRHTQLTEEHLRHVAVVVLARMENVFLYLRREMRMNRSRYRGSLDNLRTCAYDGYYSFHDKNALLTQFSAQRYTKKMTYTNICQSFYRICQKLSEFLNKMRQELRHINLFAQHSLSPFLPFVLQMGHREKCLYLAFQ